jgi:uncharacterized protein YoxC
MTKEEKEIFTNLLSEVRSLREENKKFREDINSKVSSLEKKHVPVSLEQDILTSIQGSLSKAIAEAMTGYNSPLNKLTSAVVTSHEASIKSIIDDAMRGAIDGGELRAEVADGFVHRVARTLLSTTDSLLDKATNQLKQDPQFKAKAVIAIADVVNSMQIKVNP